MKPEENPSSNAPERISVKHIIVVLLNVFNLEKGLGFTLKGLLLQPHAVVKEYLFHDRRRLVHPLRFLLLSTAIAGFLTIQFVYTDPDLQQSFGEGWASRESQKELAEGVPQAHDDTAKAKATKRFLAGYLDFITNYQNLLLIVFVPILSFGSWLIFRQRQLFFGEHLAISSYAVGYQNLLYILIVPLMKVNSDFSILYFIITPIYLVYFYINIFKTGRFQSTLAVIGLVALTYFLYILFLLIISVTLALYYIQQT